MLIESGTRTNAIKSQGRIFRMNSSIPRINTGGSSISGSMNIKPNPNPTMHSTAGKEERNKAKAER